MMPRPSFGITRREATRTLLTIAGSATLGGIATRANQSASVVPSAAPANAWPQFRGSPLLTGVSASSVPETLTTKWTFESGDIIESSPTIVDGVAYIAIGNGTLVALDLATGTARWKYSIGNNDLFGESSPAIVQGVAYVGDLAGTVHAVNTRDGNRLWTFKAQGEVRASPVVTNGIVVVGSYDTHLYGLDALTGTLRWKLQTQGQIHATAAVKDGLAFISGCDMKLHAVRVADGKQAYLIPSGAYTAASPVLDGNRAYFGTFGEEVVALDLRTRRTAWHYSDPDKRFPFFSSGALASGRLFVGGRDKSVHAINVATGKTAWTFPTKARVDSSPALAGGRVFVGSSDGRLYVLDATTGAKRWEFDCGGAVTGSPAIASGRVVVGAQNGVVYCFG
jgi:eukaryotic-like serine/threonine-protein kinase